MDSAHIDRLASQFDLAGKRVLDIGAGDGALAEAMAARGAVVTGIEVDRAKVALAQKIAFDKTMLCGSAENLPVDDASHDIACFFFSFHHVPAASQDQAMKEARRVLVPGGRLHIAEPAPHGPMSDVVKFLDDETTVRTASFARFDALGLDDGFELLAREEYILEREFPRFEAFVNRIAAVDTARRTKLPAVQNAMREAFEMKSERRGDSYILHQPCTAWHFGLGQRLSYFLSR